ncbi:MAG: M15 family metallopeptidase [Sandaracinaceae bacterium]|nr:M15 family metallopeptidase [Sandaracinaceae bacterium]
MKTRSLSVLLLASAAFALGVVVSGPSRDARAQEADAGAPPASGEAIASPPTTSDGIACNEQRPLDYLVRGNWVTKARMPREEIQRRRELAAQAVRFRTEHYGYFEGFGRPEWNAHTPMENAGNTRFMGLHLRVNRAIHPALACVEQAITAQCSATPYRAQRLSGIRDRNTYHNGEVSNHVYGIAIDVDPSVNTCCGCVPPWTDHPLCAQEVSSIFERMQMPECWVRQFERFGFYWLGRDSLQDTMHFEFLADPSQITPAAGTAPTRLAPLDQPWPTPVPARRAAAAAPRRPR